MLDAAEARRLTNLAKNPLDDVYASIRVAANKGLSFIVVEADYLDDRLNNGLLSLGNEGYKVARIDSRSSLCYKYSINW